MSYLERLIDIMDDAVAVINRDMTIKSVTTSGTLHTLSVCDLKYAQEGYEVTIGNNVYKITEVREDDGVIVVDGATVPTATYFELYPVYFTHGTPKEVNEEHTQESHTKEFTPLVWLNEIFDESPSYDDEDAIANRITPRIFALSPRPNDLLSKDLQEKYLGPMRRLMELVIDVIRSQYWIFEAQEFSPRLTNYAKFGVYINNKGVDTNLFSQCYSGVEMEGELLIKHEDDCGDCKHTYWLISEDDEDLLSEDNEPLIPE